MNRRPEWVAEWRAERELNRLIAPAHGSGENLIDEARRNYLTVRVPQRLWAAASTRFSPQLSTSVVATGDREGLLRQLLALPPPRVAHGVRLSGDSGFAGNIAT